MKTALVIALIAGCLVAGWALQPAIDRYFDDPIDCGPEGKPALDGRACIDKHPVTVTVTQ